MPQPHDLVSMTVREMLGAIRAREISRRELIEAHLQRIQETNGVINALVELRSEEALAEADAADRDRSDRSHLALDGIPVSIKEHFDVAGMKHTEGVKAFAERRSPADAAAVQRLRNAGAIVIGKSNQPEFQVRWNTLNPIYGATRNPRDLRKTVGGSSGGDAAAVAAGMVPAGLGADAGGSIRQPAACCEIYGLRPSPGRVPQVNVLEPIDAPPSLDFLGTAGPLARSVADLALLLEVLSGPHPGDPTSVPAPLGRYEDARPVRVARMVRQTGAVVEPAVEAAVDAAARILTEAGYEVVDVEIPGADRAPDLWRQLRGTELHQLAMREWRPLLSDISLGHIDRLFAPWINEGRMDVYARALVERRRIARQTAIFMEEHPLILAPIAGMPTPPFEFDRFLSQEQMESLFARHRNIVWVNCLGLPAVAVPTGVQIIARRFREDEALAAAAIIEQALGRCPIAEPPKDPAA